MRLLGAVAVSICGWGAALPAWAASAKVPPLDHAFVIILENHAYAQIIGNPKAPYINRMAHTYNLATQYHAVTHPSLPNYVALIAGDYFGIHSDAYPAWGGKGGGLFSRRIAPLSGPTIADQLVAARLTWKIYEEDLPPGGAYGVDISPGGAGGALYAVKHDPFLYFASVQNNPAMLAASVPAAQLGVDLDAGKAPNLSFIVPNQCRDMHGDGGPCRGADDAALIAAGDRAVADVVEKIRASAQWQHGSNAIFVVWDEDNFHTADNRVAAIVETNYGAKGVRDATPYTHYSLLKTLETAFNLEFLGHAADPDTALMSPLLAPTGPP